MKKAKELTTKEKKQMAKERGITVEKLEDLFLIPPSSSDSLFQNIDEAEERELTAIDVKAFRNTLGYSDKD